MKPNFHLKCFSFFCAVAIFSPADVFAAPGDLDDDGLRDEVETNTGTFVSPANTGTNPALADTDGDSLPDGMEVNLGTSPVSAVSKVKRPNIIYILVDDLGYGDIGCFWQNQRTGSGIWKFATPNLDTMAAQGAMLTHHYVGAPVCAGSRGSFLQGRHQGHADIRGTQFDKALPDNHSISSLLKSAGYKTVHLGKAGIAGTPFDSSQSSINLQGHPLKRGFDEFFGYLTHNDGWNHYPRNGALPYKSYMHNGYAPVTDAYIDVYTTDVWTAYAKKTIVEETQSHPDRPFFIYLSFSGPHFDAQFAPTAAYPSGGGINGGVQWTGAPSYVNTAINDPNRVDSYANRHAGASPTWYPAAQRYVSMVRRIDESVADILTTLRDVGADDNTLVVFTSDNGPTDKEVYPPSFQSYAGFEGLKFDLFEGGIRVPTIAWWPGTLQGTNQLTNIRKISEPLGNWDWMATFAEMAKVPVPATSDGYSIVPTLLGQPHPKPDRFLYFEFGYSGSTSRYPDFPNHGGDVRGEMQAIRIDDFMGVRYNVLSATDAFRIYDVVNDPKQATDLAAERPDLQARMKHLAIAGRRKGAGLNRNYDAALISAVPVAGKRNGLWCQSYEGYWSWLPDFDQLSAVAKVPVSTISPEPRSRDTDVGLEFTGFISVPTDGAYQFTLQSNSGTCMWVHESRVIDNDRSHVPSKGSGPVYLKAGLHPIRLYYRHQSGPPTLSLRYSGPGISDQVVPASAFFVEGPPPEIEPDSVITSQNIPVLADLLANDASSLPLTLVSAGPSVLGSTTVEGNKLRLIPAANRLGFGRFPYLANNGFSSYPGEVSATVLFRDEIWLPFEEGAGTTVGSTGINPAVVGTLTGTVDPATCWTQGKFNGGLGFDGLDDQVNFPGLSLPGGESSRTFSCWLKTSARSTPETQTLLSYGSNVTGGRFVVMLNNQPGVEGDHVLRLEVNGGHATGSTPLNDGKWHHVALVVDDHDGSGFVNVKETKVFVDGLPETLASTSGRILATGSSLVPSIGGSNHNNSSNFAGSIDDVRIFSSALSDAEVVSLHQSKVIYLADDPLENPDRDGDGMDNESEGIAGTNPNDAASVLRILGFEVVGGTVSLSWAGVEGRDYQVEESVDLAGWQAVPGVPPVRMASSGGGVGQGAPSNQLSVSFPQMGSGPRFFRLRASVFAP